MDYGSDGQAALEGCAHVLDAHTVVEGDLALQPVQQRVRVNLGIWENICPIARVSFLFYWDVLKVRLAWRGLFECRILFKPRHFTAPSRIILLSADLTVNSELGITSFSVYSHN
jgi:hypothetical protein